MSVCVCVRPPKIERLTMANHSATILYPSPAIVIYMGEMLPLQTPIFASNLLLLLLLLQLVVLQSQPSPNTLFSLVYGRHHRPLCASAYVLLLLLLLLSVRLFNGYATTRIQCDSLRILPTLNLS